MCSTNTSIRRNCWTNTIGEEPEVEKPEATGVARKHSYSRSKSVASGLPRLGTKSAGSDQLSSRNAENKGLTKFFRQVKSFVSKDKIKKSNLFQ